jgi:solute carrier family 25 phosphate transporter 3
MENKGKSITTIISETGLVRLMTKGLGTRLIMFGTLNALQWYFYDSFKSVMGMGSRATLIKPTNISNEFLPMSSIILQ